MSTFATDDRAGSHIVTFFIAEQAAGAALLAAVLGTVFSFPNIRRNVTWFNVYLAFLILSVSYLTLAVFGQAYGPRQPDFTLCLFQASLLYAAIPLVAGTLLSLCIELWVGVAKPSPLEPGLGLKMGLVIGPYALWAILFLESFMFGVFNMSSVVRQPNHPYCTINITDHTPGKVTQAIVAIIILAALVLLGLSTHRLLRVRARGGDMTHPIRLRSYDVMVRMGCFCLCGVIGAGLAFAFLKTGASDTQLEGFMGLMGAFPLLSGLILGTHKEIIGVWLSPFRREKNFVVYGAMRSPLEYEDEKSPIE